MKDFKSKEEAIEYARKYINKNSYEIVEVKGVRTFLSDTGIPIESILRNQIRESLIDFMEEMGLSYDEFLDGVEEMSAYLEGKFLVECEKILGVKIISAFSDY